MATSLLGSRFIPPKRALITWAADGTMPQALAAQYGQVACSLKVYELFYVTMLMMAMIFNFYGLYR
jgi:hypothetical protein